MTENYSLKYIPYPRGTVFDSLPRGASTRNNYSLKYTELGARPQNNVASRACASFSNGVASRAIAYF